MRDDPWMNPSKQRSGRKGGGRTWTDRYRRAVFTDVEAWFASDDAMWLYSFVAICDAIDRDAGYLRSCLGSWVASRRAASRALQPVSSSRCVG